MLQKYSQNCVKFGELVRYLGRSVGDGLAVGEMRKMACFLALTDWEEVPVIKKGYTGGEAYHIHSPNQEWGQNNGRKN